VFNRSGVLTYGGHISGSGGVTKTGVGTLVLTGSNSYAGGTNLITGVLAVNADDRLGAAGGALNIDSGTLRFDAAFNLAPTRPISIINFGTIDTNGFDTTLTQSIGGNGAFFKDGAGTLTLAGAYLRPNPPAQILAGKLIALSLFNCGSLTNNAQFQAIGSTVTIPFGLSNTAGAKTNLNDAALLVGTSFNGLSNSGQVNLTDSSVTGDVNQTIGGVTTAVGNVTFNGNILGAGALDVAGGTTRLTPTGTGTHVARLRTLGLAGARLDIGDNKLITKDAVGTWTGSNYTDVTGLIRAGRNGGVSGNWSGNGIVTSQSSATTSNFTSVGIATAQEAKGIAATATTVWAGQTVTGSDTLVMYTYGGDANLDGKINVDDYGRIDFNVGLPGAAGWFNGDFNYDGKINVDDYGIIDFNVGIQGAPFPTASSPLAALVTVPEPAGALGMVCVGALTVRRGRRARARVGKIA